MDESSVDRLTWVELQIVRVTVLVPLAMVLLLIVGRWPEYWKWIASERTPMTSLQVTIIYTTALICWAFAGFRYTLNDRLKSSKWAIIGLGFLWLALDDRFAIHERIRDGFLAPLNISIPFIPIAPGDFILVFYMLVGLLLLKWILPMMRESPRAAKRFIAGVCVAVVSVLIDTYNIHTLGLSAQRLAQTTEECVELISQVLFLQAVIIAWFEGLKKEARPSQAS